jgi:tetratricopeptide (TPR) repeat protein
MITRLTFAFARLALAPLLLAACARIQVTHVAPGESLNVALAKKPELVRLPAPPQTSVAAQAPMPPADLQKSDNTAKAADAFSRGEFCMSAGNDDEAITAFLDAVKADPTLSEAWQRLAALYEKKGDNKKAIDAFRRAKKIAAQ